MFGLGFAAGHGLQLVAQDRFVGALIAETGIYGVKKIISTLADIYSKSTFCNYTLLDVSIVDKIISLMHAEKYLTDNEGYLELGGECKADDKALTSFNDFGTKWKLCEIEDIGVHRELYVVMGY
ncbi:MAG: hypothetical protein MRQ09_00720 [Candidatus Midichloria sp.]|nr:hypothetical protein [Candidatus Midichloria sp.]